MALNEKQRRFVEAYMQHGNATQAARDAGYTHAKTQGPRLLDNVGVAAEIARRQAERTERTNITLDYVIQRLAIEAELTQDQGGTQSGRVAALRELRQHFAAPPVGADDEAPALSIKITAAAPVRDVRVTNG